MAMEYKLKYTAKEIEDKLEQVDKNTANIAQIPDWNQSDETTSDYIKNKPFYEYVSTAVDNVTVNNGDTLEFKVYDYGNKGDFITVIWDGVTYNKTIGFGKTSGGFSSLGHYTIGNKSYLDNSSVTFENTGEEYLIETNKDTGVTTVHCDNNQHILSVIKYELVKIDEKFLPYINKGNAEYIGDVIANAESTSPISLVDVAEKVKALDNFNGANTGITKEKSPITLARFFYNHLTNIPADTFEEKAQYLARYDVFVYQAYLSNDLTMSRNPYDEELAIYQRALEINPDLKVFGYLTARGFAFDLDTQAKVGMTEYRTSPSNVDYQIYTKEELYAYMNLMAHCGGAKTDEVDEFGNPVLTGGIPLHGVFFDDYGFNFGYENTSLMNQGDWASVREKQNDLIDYAHSIGLSVMANSSPDDIFGYTATTSYFNPNGERSHMNENDWVCLESYFLRSDDTYALNNDDHAVTYREQYKDIYNSKVLALTYLSAVNESDVEGRQIASTFATYQALCQGIDSIALHGTSMYMEIPSDFSKYYSFNDSAVYTADVKNGTYSVSANGHTVTTTRNISKTAYGQIPNANTLSSCKVTIDGSHTFNNGYLRSEEVLYELNEFEHEINQKISEISTDFAESSNLYHRAFIDDWDNTYSLSDYTNYATTFKNAFGGEDSGTTSTWNSEYPYDVTIRLPQAWSWRRVLMDVSDLKGKTVEIGFDSCNVCVEDDTTQHPVLTWQVIGDCESNSWTEITTFKTNALITSIDGVNRCGVKFTVPEDIKELIFWCQRTSSSPSGAWIVDAKGLYLIDPSEHTVTKTWFTNYAPPSENWRVNGNSYTMEHIENGVKVHYNSLTTSYETNMNFPKNDSIFKAGETWELGVKDLKMIRSDGVDVTNKICFSLNLGTDIGINTWIAGLSYLGYKNRKSNTGDNSLISLARFTIPETYNGGMPSTPLYLYPENYAGGDDNGFYTLTVEGLYLYNLDERDELKIRGEDPSETYIKLNRINEYNPNETLEPDSLYIVGDGMMFATNRKREKIDIIGSGSSVGSTDVSNKVSLPRDDSGNIQHGTIGQFAVSDGNGGITWMTIINGSEEAW